jgi:hypothetical protein
MKRDARGGGGRRQSDSGGGGAAVGRPAVALALIALVSFLLGPGAGARLVAESGLSWGFDSNVFEAVNRDRWVGDTFARMEAGLQREDPARAGGSWFGQVRMAGEQYVRNRSQDRNLVLGSLGWLQRGTRAAGDWRWTGQSADRMHADSLSLQRHQLTHTGSATLRPGTRVGWLADAVWVHTRAGGPAARRGWQAGGDVQRVLGRGWRASARCEGGEVRFDTPAVTSWGGGTNVVASEDQRDRNLLLGLDLDWSAVALAHVAYGYRTIHSNSLGYSQIRHELAISLSWLLPYRVSLQAVGLWQEPRYRDQGFAKWRLRDDPEDLDVGARSGVTLRLRRPVAEGFSADVQAGWEHNEARVTGRYYERVQLLFSIRYQPGR